MTFNMKKNLLLATTIVAAASLFTACGGSKLKGFEQTADGIYYHFDKHNSDAQQVQEGDVLVGEMTFRLDSTIFYSNVGHPARIMQADGNMDIPIHEGLLMMHSGDKATFAYDADAMAKLLEGEQMPPTYEPGKGMKFYWEISLADIVTREEISEEMANFQAEMRKAQEAEPKLIADYVASNKVKEQPRDNGLYVIVKKKGNGPAVEVGRQVQIGYTGRLLDGTIFDSSKPEDWPQAHEPLNYVVGKMSLIPGWEEGMRGQNEGTSLRLIIPSELAYGSMGIPQGDDYVIPPYSPLVFDIDILSVK